MTKKQFLLELRDFLNGRVEEREITRQVHYYEDYINSQVAGGKEESLVIEELGDPRLLAKTIIASSPVTNESRRDNSYGNTESVKNRYHPNESKSAGFFTKIKRWGILLLILFFVLVMMITLFSIIRFFIPVIFIFLIIWFFMFVRKK